MSDRTYLCLFLYVAIFFESPVVLAEFDSSTSASTASGGSSHYVASATSAPQEPSYIPKDCGASWEWEPSVYSSSGTFFLSGEKRHPQHLSDPKNPLSPIVSKRCRVSGTENWSKFGSWSLQSGSALKAITTETRGVGYFELLEKRFRHDNVNGETLYAESEIRSKELEKDALGVKSVEIEDTQLNRLFEQGGLVWQEGEEYTSTTATTLDGAKQFISTKKKYRGPELATNEYKTENFAARDQVQNKLTTTERTFYSNNKLSSEFENLYSFINEYQFSDEGIRTLALSVETRTEAKGFFDEAENLVGLDLYTLNAEEKKSADNIRSSNSISCEHILSVGNNRAFKRSTTFHPSGVPESFHSKYLVISEDGVQGGHELSLTWEEDGFLNSGQLDPVNVPDEDLIQIPPTNYRECLEFIKWYEKFKLTEYQVCRRQAHRDGYPYLSQLASTVCGYMNRP